MKVLLVVIDAASPRVFCPAVQTRRLRHLARIVDAGAMHQSSVTIFPSITPAATSSIITGTYPATHGIAGAAWYDDARQEIAYYGDDFWTIAKEGFGAFVRDFLVRLNGDRLKAPTLFEIIEGRGLKATSVNYLVYKGLVAHDVTIPRALTLFPGVPRTETVLGPSALCLGDFVTPCTGDGRKVEDRGGVMHRFGMDDASTAAMLATLAERNELGDFTLAYFADNDYRSHQVGPFGALPILDAVDAAIGTLFDAAGGADRFLAETCVIVTSDHGHCDILDDAEVAVIRLDTVFAEFRQADLARGWREQDEILICPNMRAAQLYLQRPNSVTIDRLTRAALADDRIDLVLWHTRVATGGRGDRYMAFSRRGRLEFWRTESDSYDAADPFGTRWCWRGDPDVLSLQVEARTVASADYPNAFERIAGVLDAPNSGEMWLTARPGCEFELPGGKAHVGGGSHGALHALDSFSPLIIGGAGAPDMPRHPRVVDIAPLCLDLLGLSRR